MRKKRPKTLEGNTTKYTTNCGNLFLTLNFDKGELFEIRSVLGKSGTCVRGWMEMSMIMLSQYIQLDIDNEEKIKMLKRHLQEIHCGNAFNDGEDKYTSCMDLIARKCVEELENGKEDKKTT